MLAPEAVVCAQTPPLEQSKETMNPREHGMGRHIANDARIVAIIRQAVRGGFTISDSAVSGISA